MSDARETSQESERVTASLLRRRAGQCRALHRDGSASLAPDQAARDFDNIAAAFLELEQDRDAALELAEESEQRAVEAVKELAALRAETADLREIERCKRSIEAAGCAWTLENPGYTGNRLRVNRRNHASPIYVSCADEAPTLSDWHSAERAAWECAAEPYRERIEAAGYRLELRFGEEELPAVDIQTRDWMSPWKAFTEFGTYPTREALEAAAAWAEAPPANSPDPEPDEPDRPHKPAAPVVGVDPARPGSERTVVALLEFGETALLVRPKVPDGLFPISLNVGDQEVTGEWFGSLCSDGETLNIYCETAPQA